MRLSFKLLDASLLALAASLALTITAQAHSGGTNSQGCHAGTQPYHCHNDGDDDDSSEYDSPGGSSGSSGQPINDRSGNVYEMSTTLVYDDNYLLRKEITRPLGDNNLPGATT